MKKSLLSLLCAPLLFAWALAISGTAYSDAALYDAPIPADKSLVRFVNAKLDSDASVDFSSTSYRVGSEALSGYHIIQNGTYDISDGSSSVQATLEPGKFYTVAIGVELDTPQTVLVIKDKDVKNPSKSALSFYNFSGTAADLALRLNEDTRTLFSGIEPGSMDSRELPAVDIGLVVTAGGAEVLSADSVTLAADKRQNVLVLHISGAPAAYVIETKLEK